ncbi:MAG TPA: ATP-binding protein [Gemmatimonadaceae bacterium]|nr:ATP-binding protein [Gemmatimonadaceae bacterium]
MKDPSHNEQTSPVLSHVKMALELRFPSDVRYIERVVELVTRQCAELEFHPRHLALNVPVALTEALSNAILRGNREVPSRTVQVRAEVDRDRLVLEVVDEGAGFDLDACLVDPTSPENLTREDGRGLFLMKRLMDRIERFTNHGNVVRMTLRRHD